MNSKDYLLPSSIILGAALIGLGLFFGVRGSPPTHSAMPPTGNGSSSAAVMIDETVRLSSGSSNSPPPALSSLPRENHARAQTDAISALAIAKRDQLVAACWTPALAKAPEPRTSRYTLNVTFNTDGSEIGRGISELRDADSRADVAACLRLQSPFLRIPPQNAPVSVELTLEFP